MKTERIYLECPECNGEGGYDLFISCLRPMSECCGGCTKQVKCKECDSTGEKHYDLDQRTFKVYKYFATNNKGHKKINELIESIIKNQ